MANFWMILSVYLSTMTLINAISYGSRTTNSDAGQQEQAASEGVSFRANMLRESLVIVPNKSNNAQYTETSSTCLCSKLYDPVCSTDNKSFYNPCRLDCYAKYWKSPIAIKHQGNCIVYK